MIPEAPTQANNAGNELLNADQDMQQRADIDIESGGVHAIAEAYHSVASVSAVTASHMPRLWVQRKNDQGRVYFLNNVTNERRMVRTIPTDDGQGNPWHQPTGQEQQQQQKMGIDTSAAATATATATTAYVAVSTANPNTIACSTSLQSVILSNDPLNEELNMHQADIYIEGGSEHLNDNVLDPPLESIPPTQVESLLYTFGKYMWLFFQYFLRLVFLVIFCGQLGRNKCQQQWPVRVAVDNR